MKRIINIKLTFVALLMGVLFTSCLKSALPKYPAFGGDLITKVYVEYRWLDATQTYNGQPVVNYQQLNVDSQQIDTVNNVVNLSLSVPAANGSFSDAIKSNVDQSHLWIYADLSTAAIVAPTAGTPAFGNVTDLTKPQTFVVTAANGQKRTWKIVVNSFVNN